MYIPAFMPAHLRQSLTVAQGNQWYRFVGTNGEIGYCYHNSCVPSICWLDSMADFHSGSTPITTRARARLATSRHPMATPCTSQNGMVYVV